MLLRLAPRSTRAAGAVARRHQRRWFPTAYVRSEGGGDIYLVGTAHVGKKSREEVVEIITTVKPKAVMVELCRERAAALTRRGGFGGGGRDGAATRAMLERFGLDAKSAELALSIFERVAGFVGEQGGDMLAALETGRRIDAKIVHGDVSGATTERAVRAAAQRLISSPTDAAALAARLGTDTDVMRIVGAMGKAAMGGGGLDAMVAGCLDRDTAARLGAVLDRHAPELATALLHERDEHMSRELSSAAASYGTVVGVVGIAHMDGIERRFPNATVLHL